MPDTAPAPLREQVALAIYRELEGHDPFEKDVSPLGSASGRMADAALAVVRANLPERRAFLCFPDTWHEGFNGCLDEIDRLTKEGSE